MIILRGKDRRKSKCIRTCDTRQVQTASSIINKALQDKGEKEGNMLSWMKESWILASAESQQHVLLPRVNQHLSSSTHHLRKGIKIRKVKVASLSQRRQLHSKNRRKSKKLLVTTYNCSTWVDTGRRETCLFPLDHPNTLSSGEKEHFHVSVLQFEVTKYSLRSTWSWDTFRNCPVGLKRLEIRREMVISLTCFIFGCGRQDVGH